VIDWFPSRAEAAHDDDGGRLVRWRAVVAVRRLARTLDAGPRLVGHADRVADLAAALARELGWPERRVADLREAALVHDVGLTCTEPGGTDEHAAVGARIVAAALGPAAVAWVQHHHDRWDAGAGVPDGAFLIGLADAYDAMCPGSWDRSMTPDEALAHCRADRGRRFAPWAVDALVRVVRRDADAAPPPPAPLQLVPL
jgi:HD-GYP domain-containing protein (c-di-GMP phosphodiesterase class II)